jgi:hypothetical protein
VCPFNSRAPALPLFCSAPVNAAYDFAALVFRWHFARDLETSLRALPDDVPEPPGRCTFCALVSDSTAGDGLNAYTSVVKLHFRTH